MAESDYNPISLKAKLLADYKSITAIARESGLSRYMVSRLMDPTYEAKSETKETFNKYFRNFTYEVYREGGMSSSNARSFRTYSYETFVNTNQKLTSLVSSLTDGVVQSMLNKYKKLNITVDIDIVYSDARNSVLEGLRSSKKTLAEQLDYIHNVKVK